MPTPISISPWDQTIPSTLPQTIGHVRLFFVEDLRTARRFLRSIIPDFPIDESTFLMVNEHQDPLAQEEWMDKLSKNDAVLMSEAGMPSIADPGAELVRFCHAMRIAVKPIPGPNSITLLLAASGLNGQQFSFHGYLPKDKQDRRRKIAELVQDCQRTGFTHLFIEAPYRNEALMDDLQDLVPSGLMIALGKDLCGAEEFIQTKEAAQWKNDRPYLHKTPVVYAIGK